MPSERWERFPSELSSHTDWPKRPSFPTLQASALVTSRKRFGYIIPMSPGRLKVGRSPRATDSPSFVFLCSPLSFCKDRSSRDLCSYTTREAERGRT